MSAAGLVVKAKELLPTKPPVALERADALLPGLWGEEGPLDIRHLEDTRLYVRSTGHHVEILHVLLLFLLLFLVFGLRFQLNNSLGEEKKGVASAEGLHTVGTAFLYALLSALVAWTADRASWPQEALQHVNTLRHEVDVVLVWLEQMEVGLEDKQASLQAQQDAKQADAQDRQRVLLGDVLAAVMGEMEGRHS